MKFTTAIGSSAALARFSVGRVVAASVLSACAAAPALAQQTVYNAYFDINGNYWSPPVFSYNCFTCTGTGVQNMAEWGDIITLGGTQRVLDTATVMVGQFSGAGFSSYNADVTFSIYSVSNIGPTPTVTLLGQQTNTYAITASNAIFDLTFNFQGSGIVMPNTLYYGVSVASSSPQVAQLRIGLWDYLSPLTSGTGSGAAGPDPVTIAPGSLRTGTDLGTFVSNLSPLTVSSVIYGRTTANPGQVVQSQPGVVGGPSINTGFTPAVILTAVPEPQTYALMLLGVAAVVAFSAKRGRKA